MRLPTTSVRSRRFVGGTVAALLTANAFAFATLVNDDGPSDGRFRDVEAAAIPEIPPLAPAELALITTTDGRTFTVDPSTPEGRRAIRDAKREGATVREIAMPGPGRVEALPATRDEKLPGQPGLLDPAPAGDEVGNLTDALRTAPSTLTSVVGGVGSTVSTLLPTVSSVVGGVGSTVDSVVGGVGSTVGSVVGGVGSTVGSVVDGLTPTTAEPSLVGGLLGGLETVVGVTQSETTTEPPASDPVCTLLVFCR